MQIFHCKTNMECICSNLLIGVELNVQFTMNGMCTKNSILIYVARTSNNRVISVVACCHSVKLCAFAAQALQLQQNVAVTKTWRSCQVQPLQKECVIGAVRCKKVGMLLQPLHWRCVQCVIHHERDVREE